MQHPSGRRALALVAALALGTAGSALAQDTTRIPAQRGTSDSLPSDSAAAGKGDGYRSERPPAADSTQ